LVPYTKTKSPFNSMMQEPQVPRIVAFKSLFGK
jgi:hypothetical protein